jgi:hypothetical protein
MRTEAFLMAQRALADLKTAVLTTLEASPLPGLRNSQIGRMLGIYGGHKGHQGHISRTVLHMLELDGVIRQDQDTKLWSMRSIDQIGESGLEDDE